MKVFKLAITWIERVEPTNLNQPMYLLIINPNLSSCSLFISDKHAQAITLVEFIPQFRSGGSMV